ncbi:60S ribosomal protein L37a-like [Peromyscus californicus insignis]|uniref:60S ribosomal protein L37a-like n=1 Tax=Peromyscus californicus insignis TaxID=564181 RepID=UPI0022A7960B|nr:60S ribosomal protein L37a-like [Peromyscus californicus insignis]
MVKCTKKVSITGKHRTCSNDARWKVAKKTEISWHVKYIGSFWGKTKMKKQAISIWHCSSCIRTVAGEAWTCNTPSRSVKSAIGRLKESKDQ